MKYSTLARQLSIIKNYFKSLHDKVTAFEKPLLDDQVKQLELYNIEVNKKHTEYNSIVNKIFELEDDDFDEDKFCELQTNIFDIYVKTHSTIKTLLEIKVDSNVGLTRLQSTRPTSQPIGLGLDDSSDLNDSSNLNPTITPRPNVDHMSLKLPHLALKTFNGAIDQWLSYVSLFKVAVHDNANVSNVERFQYLLSTLQGEPFNLVKNLPITHENYDVAWNILHKRYQNSRHIVSLHVNSIIDLPNMSDTSVKNIRLFVNKYQENAQALLALDQDISKDNVILSTLLLRKIHSDLRQRFECLRLDSQVVPSVEDIVKFLENECLHLEAANLSLLPNKSGHSQSHSSNNYTNSLAHTRPKFAKDKINTSQTRAVLISSPNVNSFNCIVCCKVGHGIYNCDEFKEKTPQERYNVVKDKNLCINCLGTSHTVKYCKSKHVCLQCKRKHHTMLHLTSGLLKSNDQSSNQQDSASVQPPLVAVASTTSTTILLGTALVHLTSSNGNTLVVRAVVDSASMVTCISEATASLLSLKRHSDQQNKVDGLSSCQVKTKGVSKINISALNGIEVATNHPVIILDRITSNLPQVEVPTDVKNKYSNLVLADPTFHKPSPVDVLIGADLFPKVLTGERILLNDKLPAAMNSVFGYVIIGAAPVQQATGHNISKPYNGIVTLLSTQDINLHQSLQRFWTIDECPNKPHISDEEEVCEKMFLTTHSRDAEGRYIVRLPIKEGHAPLGDSITCARKRFMSLEKQLSSKPELKIKYSNMMNEAISAGHMELVDIPPALDTEHFVLPHHAVIKEESSTTKLRVVFDASAQSSTGISLNDIFHTGPSLQNSLPDVLFHFRYYPYVFSCDIKQMFRMIKVHPEDRKYQLLFWREEPTQPLLMYQLTTVVFGFNCSPFLAIRTMHQLIEDEGSNFPLAAQVLRKQAYVDDLILGANSIESSLKLRDEIIKLLAKGGFEPRKWTSNCKELIDVFPDSHKEIPRLQATEQPHFSVLGMKWSPESDCFFYKVNLPKRLEATKRIILSTICKIFDPCGFIAPITLWIKSLIQALWVTKIGWDENIPDGLKNKWSKFISQLPSLNEICFSRHLSLSDATDIQLHGFCDGSESGYGATVYLRTISSQGKVKTHLLLAKARVAPLKRMSIPRLELCGAHLLAKLLSHCNQILSENYKINSIHAWSDSTVILSWIRTLPFRLKVYVANRVADIQELVPTHVWSHVPTDSNPADVASRGSLPSSLITNELWWKGPAWLLIPDSEWPRRNITPLEEEELPEMKPEPLPILLATEKTDFLSKFSSLSKLQRVMSYVMRFIEATRNKQTEKSFLKCSEMENAMSKICKIVQNQHFKDEIHSIKANKTVSKPFARLSPFVGSDGLLRVGGRLQKSDLTDSAKHPILLPKCNVTDLIIDHYHHKYLHAGPAFLQANISQKYWILSARSAIRKRVFKCIRCFRCRPKLLNQKMGDLPRHRITPSLRAFMNCGTDFAGPFYIKPNSLRRTTPVKMYLCIFVCFAVKAVHIEIVSSLSSEAFIAALTRFVSRRGLCSTIYCDNGTNYVGAASELKNIKKLFQSETSKKTLEKFSQENMIDFHFLPPASPHQGGLWERSVRSIKHHLHRVVGDHLLTYEEFLTLSTRVEAILNSRPLTPLSADPAEVDVLTPGHFLVNGPLLSLPETQWENTPLNRLSRWQLIQSLGQSIWKRWSKEYLYTLQQRSKWLSPKTNIKVGDLVIVHEPNSPPLHWKLGRIVKVFPGQDHLVRVVQLKTATGVITRPVTKISPLPLD